MSFQNSPNFTIKEKNEKATYKRSSRLLNSIGKRDENFHRNFLNTKALVLANATPH